MPFDFPLFLDKFYLKCALCLYLKCIFSRYVFIKYLGCVNKILKLNHIHPFLIFPKFLHFLIILIYFSFLFLVSYVNNILMFILNILHLKNIGQFFAKYMHLKHFLWEFLLKNIFLFFANYMHLNHFLRVRFFNY